MTPNEWRSHLTHGLPDHVRKNIQIVKAATFRENLHGDVTMASNGEACQEEAPDWTTFSDAHNVVMALVRLLAGQTHLSTNPRAASAEQLARLEEENVAKAQPQVASSADLPALPMSTVASAEQPARIQRAIQVNVLGMDLKYTDRYHLPNYKISNKYVVNKKN